MTMHLKKLVPDDIPELVSIEQECFSDPWSEGLLSALLESAFDETWVLRLDDGTAAGYIDLRFLAGEGELMRIAVRPEYRGRGYSRKMMEQMVNICRGRAGARHDPRGARGEPGGHKPL